MSLLWFLDHLVFRILKMAMNVLNHAAPFGKRQVVLCVVAMYMAGAIASVVSGHTHFKWLIMPTVLTVLIVPNIQRFSNREKDLFAMVGRVFVGALMVGCLVRSCLIWDFPHATSRFAYGLLFYALDLSEESRGRRYRHIEVVRKYVPRPGFSTAA